MIPAATSASTAASSSGSVSWPPQRARNASQAPAKHFFFSHISCPNFSKNLSRHKEDETIKPKAVECVGEIPSPVNVPTGCSFHTRCPYKCERCTKEDPVMREVEPGHTVRCHLIDK